MSSFAVANYGEGTTASSWKKAFRFHVAQALSSKIIYEAYDNDSSWPSTGSAVTVTNHCFTRSTGMMTDRTGSPHASGSIICLIDVSTSAAWGATFYGNGTALTTAWGKCIPYANRTTSNPNRLKGTTNKVLQSGAILGANSNAQFNMFCIVPYVCQTSDDMGFDLTVRYTYTGVDPTPRFQVNTAYGGGYIYGHFTAAETWRDMSGSGTAYGIKHCRADVADGSLYANIPQTSYEKTREGWAANAAS